MTIFNTVVGNSAVGSVTITQNGSYDVSSYAQAIVDVSGGGGSISLGSVTIGMPTVYYTDANMTRQTATAPNYLIGAQLPIGSIVVGYGVVEPGSPSDSGITLVTSWTISRQPIRVYEVTG